MLTDEFRRERASAVRDLAAMANDPFIKDRLLKLVSRYEEDRPKASKLQTPLDLQFKAKDLRSER